MKYCPRCGFEKSLDEFNKAKGRKDGHQPYCRDCTKQINNDGYATGPRKVQVRASTAAIRRRNQDYVKAWLATRPCVDCGEPDIVVLEFDHVRGRKLGTISQMVLDCVSLAKIAAEIDKCEVRCANDHRRRTVERRKSLFLAGLG